MYSEVRLQRRRNTRLLVRVILGHPRVVMFDVLGADALLPFRVYRTEVGDGRGPWHGEDAWVIDRKFQLQPSAPICRIDVVGPDMAPFLFAARLRLFGGVVVDETITLDHVEAVRVRSTETVDAAELSRLDTDGIDDQRVALVMADGIAVP